MIDLAHFGFEHADWTPSALDPNILEDVANFELCVATHPMLCSGAAKIELFQARSRVRGRRLKARAMLLLGESGAGKTTMLEWYESHFPIDTGGPDGDIRKVLYAEVPNGCTKRALVAAILGELGYEVDRSWTANDIIEKIAFYATEQGVELIILDEAHHIIHGEDSLNISEFLKSLLNRLKAQILIAGLPELQDLRRYPQFKRRLEPDLVLRPYDWRNPVERAAFLSVLVRLEAELKLPDPSNLAEHDTAKRLFIACSGHIGIVSKYLSSALLRARTRGLRRIDRDLLAEIHASWTANADSPQSIDFDAVLDESMLLKHQSPWRNPDNVFLCSDERCQSLWEELQRATVDRVGARLEAGSRATNLRGRGRRRVVALAA